MSVAPIELTSGNDLNFKLNGIADIPSYDGPENELNTWIGASET